MKTQNLIFFCCFRKVPEGSRTARPAALRPGRGGQSGGLSARARESPFRRTKDEVLQKRRTSSFFVVFGKFRKGVEQPVRPPCVPAGADSPADCPQGRGRVPSGAPKMRFCENTKPHLFAIFWKLPPFAQNGCRAWFLPCPLLLTKCRP